MKKLLLGLGTLAIVVAPIATVVACSSKHHCPPIQHEKDELLKHEKNLTKDQKDQIHGAKDMKELHAIMQGIHGKDFGPESSSTVSDVARIQFLENLNLDLNDDIQATKDVPHLVTEYAWTKGHTGSKKSEAAKWNVSLAIVSGTEVTFTSGGNTQSVIIKAQDDKDEALTVEQASKELKSEGLYSGNFVVVSTKEVKDKLAYTDASTYNVQGDSFFFTSKDLESFVKENLKGILTGIKYTKVIELLDASPETFDPKTLTLK